MAQPVPRLQSGRTFFVIEPTGARFFLRWQARVEREMRWHPDDVKGDREWHRDVIWPRWEFNGNNPKWYYFWTQRGAKRALRRWEEKQVKEVARIERRIEVSSNCL